MTKSPSLLLNLFLLIKKWRSNSHALALRPRAPFLFKGFMNGMLSDGKYIPMSGTPGPSEGFPLHLFTKELLSLLLFALVFADNTSQLLLPSCKASFSSKCLHFYALQIELIEHSLVPFRSVPVPC